MEHPKASRKLSKTIREAEKVSQVKGADKNSNSPLYRVATKSDFFITKAIKNNKTITSL